MNTLVFNHQRLAGEELKQFSESKIYNNDTPAWERDIFQFILAWLGEDDSIIQYSSGTTGKSKKLRLLKKSMLQSAENTLSFFKLIRGQTAVLCLPVDYIAGKMMVVRCLAGGLNLEITEPKSRPDLSGFKKIDFCSMVPLQLINIIKKGGDLSGIHKLLIGGTEVTRELESLVSKIPTAVYAGFGMAETCSHVALRKLNNPGREEYYRALPGVTLSNDKRNCLVITSNYLPDIVVTNDLVEFTGSGTFRWIGRYDNLINSAGIKIVPEELEAQFAERTRLECAVIGLPDERLGQRPVLVLEKKPELTESNIKQVIGNIFPFKKQITEIAWIDKFPRNASAKLDRQKLTEMVRRMR
jgi:O-succinylbenzoic acid--CoA ligase